VTRPVIYFAHPLGGADVGGNVRRALRWLAWLMVSEPDVAFIAPWLAAAASGADDHDPRARERGLLDAVAVVERCDGIVLCGGRVSNGMQRETNVAILAGRWVSDLTSIGDHPPSETWEGGVLTAYRVRT
jgi:hypothetical protein